MMNLDEWLGSATKQLAEADISTARLDCLVLLADELGQDKAWIFSHSDEELQGSVLEKLNKKVIQRAQHIPLGYIRGHAEFYGREFMVNEHTLVPRPETETMIDELRSVIKHESQTTIVDIGTGSGAIAITAKLEAPEATVIATDIDKQCLSVASQNAKQLVADISFLQGNLLKPLTESLDAKIAAASAIILLVNLPYVPDDFQINTAATHEPKHAIFGGSDGLKYYRELFQQIQTSEWKPAYILTESLPPQHAALALLAKAAGYSLTKTNDFIQLFVLSFLG